MNHFYFFLIIKVEDSLMLLLIDGLNSVVFWYQEYQFMNIFKPVCDQVFWY